MPKPVLQSLILADHVYEDKLTGKRIIAGIFNRIIRGVRVVRQVGPPLPPPTQPAAPQYLPPPPQPAAPPPSAHSPEDYSAPPQYASPSMSAPAPPSTPATPAMPAEYPPAAHSAQPPRLPPPISRLHHPPRRLPLPIAIPKCPPPRHILLRLTNRSRPFNPASSSPVSAF